MTTMMNKDYTIGFLLGVLEGIETLASEYVSVDSAALVSICRKAIGMIENQLNPPAVQFSEPVDDQ